MTRRIGPTPSSPASTRGAHHDRRGAHHDRAYGELTAGNGTGVPSRNTRPTQSTVLILTGTASGARNDLVRSFIRTGFGVEHQRMPRDQQRRERITGREAELTAMPPPDRRRDPGVPDAIEKLLGWFGLWEIAPDEPGSSPNHPARSPSSHSMSTSWLKASRSPAPATSRWGLPPATRRAPE